MRVRWYIYIIVAVSGGLILPLFLKNNRVKRLLILLVFDYICLQASLDSHSLIDVSFVSVCVVHDSGGAFIACGVSVEWCESLFYAVSLSLNLRWWFFSSFIQSKLESANCCLYTSSSYQSTLPFMWKCSGLPGVLSVFETAVSTMFPSLSLNLLACHLMDNIEYTVVFKSFFLTPRTGNYE